MRWIRSFYTASESLFDRVLCVIGAGAFSQAPEFMQQYLQRLGGALGEAKRQLKQFQDVAQSSGLTLDRLIAQVARNSDAGMAGLGRVMVETEKRVSILSGADIAIRDASPLMRPFEFMRHVDPEIAGNTWSIFKPAVPTSFEGLAYALIGTLVVLALYHGVIRYPVRRICGAFSRQKAPTPVPRDSPRFTV